MSLDPEIVQKAIRHAVEKSALQTVEQAALKPLSVLAIDKLVPDLRLGLPESPPPFLCVNGMESVWAGSAWDLRRKVTENKDKAFLSNLVLYRHECLVDMNLMFGADEPYETLLTAESEGYAGHGSHLGEGTRAAENGFLWDFYKLLHVPSPVRLMITLCAPQNQSLLVKRLDGMVKKYAILPKQLDPDCDIWSVSFPTTSLVEHKVLVHRWAPEKENKRVYTDHSFLAR